MRCKSLGGQKDQLNKLESNRFIKEKIKKKKRNHIQIANVIIRTISA